MRCYRIERSLGKHLFGVPRCHDSAWCWDTKTKEGPCPRDAWDSAWQSAGCCRERGLSVLRRQGAADRHTRRGQVLGCRFGDCLPRSVCGGDSGNTASCPVGERPEMDSSRTPAFTEHSWPALLWSKREISRSHFQRLHVFHGEGILESKQNEGLYDLF